MSKQNKNHHDNSITTINTPINFYLTLVASLMLAVSCNKLVRQENSLSSNPINPTTNPSKQTPTATPTAMPTATPDNSTSSIIFHALDLQHTLHFDPALDPTGKAVESDDEDADRLALIDALQKQLIGKPLDLSVTGVDENNAENNILYDLTVAYVKIDMGVSVVTYDNAQLAKNPAFFSKIDIDSFKTSSKNVKFNVTGVALRAASDKDINTNPYLGIDKFAANPVAIIADSAQFRAEYKDTLSIDLGDGPTDYPIQYGLDLTVDLNDDPFVTKNSKAIINTNSCKILAKDVKTPKGNANAISCSAK